MLLERLFTSTVGPMGASSVSGVHKYDIIEKMNIGRELICDVKLLVTFNDFVNDKYEFSPCVCFVGELHLGCISVRVAKPKAALTSPFLGHLFEHDLIIWVSMSFDPSVCPSVRSQ